MNICDPNLYCMHIYTFDSVQNVSKKRERERERERKIDTQNLMTRLTSSPKAVDMPFIDSASFADAGLEKGRVAKAGSAVDRPLLVFGRAVLVLGRAWSSHGVVEGRSNSDGWSSIVSTISKQD